METNRVTELMTESYVCSESVLLATCEAFGIEVDEKVIPKSLRSSHGYSQREVAWELPRELFFHTGLTTPEGIDQLMDSDVPQTVCFPAVATAYRLVVDLLKETP